MKKFFLLVVMLLFVLKTLPSNAQCLDKFGFNLGYTHSTLSWSQSDFQWNPSGLPVDPYLSGVSVLGFAEKSLNRTLALRSQFGYMSQGYGTSENKRYADSPPYPTGNVEGFRFHQLALDLGVKVNFSRGCLNPYLTAGIRNHYTMAFQLLDPYPKEAYRKLVADDFNRYTLSGTLGVGMEICHAFFIEAEYNPALSNTIRYDSYRGRSRSFGLKIGYFLVNPRTCIKPKKVGCGIPVF